MKQYLLYLLLGTFLLASCQQEEIPTTEGYGYLSVTGITTQTVTEEVASTRSGDSPLTIEIWQGEELVRTLAEADLQNKIRLEAGSYTLKAYSDSYGKEQTWTNSEKGEPVYYTEQAFTVETEQTTSVEVSVPMINFGVTFSLPEEYSGYFSSCTFTATVGERSVSLQEGETAYFSYTEGAAFSYTLNATNSDNEPFNQSGSYGGTEAGETISSGTVYTVTYNVETRQFDI